MPIHARQFIMCAAPIALIALAYGAAARGCPADSFGNPYGGNVLVAGQVELIIPVPAKWSGSTRASFFYNIG